MSALRTPALALASLLLATLTWASLLHFVYRPPAAELSGAGVSSRADALAQRQLALWERSAEGDQARARMRRTNPEWDFMGRTFWVLSLANLAERDPARKAACLEVIDMILADTLALEQEHGFEHFLLGYGRGGRWVAQPPRSLFVDGEIALMLGARCLVEDRAELHAPLAARIEAIVARMSATKTKSAESYPDECWTFCNTAALAATTIADRVLGQDHRAFRAAWVETAKGFLIDPKTGLLGSKYTLAGEIQDGPEGSSIWWSIHCLYLVDPSFADDQYVRARRELGETLLGFGYAREWPRSWPNVADVDSGPIVPFVEASAGSSGLALLGAASAGDRDYQAALVTSLDFAAFPLERERDGRRELHYGAGNQVGDAVLLYSLVQGPLWAKARGGSK